MNAPIRVAQATSVAQATGAAHPDAVTRVTKPQGGQAVAVHLDGAGRLDLSAIAAERITLVRAGDRLVILFDNQATVTVEPFFGTDGQPLDHPVQLGADRVVGAAQFATLFPITDDQSILPAAGEGSAGSRNTGGQFGSFQIDGFGGRTALDLLGGETTSAGRADVATLDNGVPTALDLALGLDEDEIDLDEGNLAGTGDDPTPSTVTGTLPVSFGADGFGGLFFNVAPGPVTGLTAGGDPVSLAISADGLTITASSANGVVFTVALTVNADSSVSYQVTLFQTLDHAGLDEDNIVLDFPFTVQDSNGDSVTATLTLSIDDDTPLITLAGAEHGAVDEDGLPGGNAGDSYALGDAHGEALTATGSLGISWGADRVNDVANGGVSGSPVAGDRAVVFTGLVDGSLTPAEVASVLTVVGANGPVDLGLLTSNGEALTFTLSGNGTILTATTAGGPVFTVTLSDTSDTGSYSFVLQGALEHPAAGTEDDLDLSFGYTAYDSDGDAVDGRFTVTVNDDAPELAAAPETKTVDEERIPWIGGNPGGDGDVIGPDNDVTGNLNIAWGADSQDDVAPGLPNRDVVFHGVVQNAAATALGDTGTIPLTSDGHPVHLWVSADGRTVYGYVGNAPANGQAPSHHQRVFTVDLDDDGGANDGGTWRFTLHDNLDHPTSGTEDDLTLSFGFKATDADGDSITGSFAVMVDDDTPVIGCPEDESVDEDDLPANILDGIFADFPDSAVQVGDLEISWGADANDSGTMNRTVEFTTGTAPADLTSDGIPVEYVLSADGKTLTAYQGGIADAAHRVFEVTLSDDGSGRYVFVLYGNIDHAASGAGDDVRKLSFGFRATDSDGDSATDSFDVTIVDDAPRIGHPEEESVNEDDLAGGNDPGPNESLTETGTLAISWGADDANAGGANDRSVAFAAGIQTGTAVTFNPPGPDSSDPVTSDGQPVQFVRVSDTLIIGVADTGQGVGADANGVVTAGREVFRVTITDAGSGSYVFTLVDQLDHPARNGENKIELEFGFVAKDSDGDTDSDSFTVAVTDDGPVAPNSTAPNLVAEDAASPVLNDVALGIAWGADDNDTPNAANIDRTIAFSSTTVALAGSSAISTLKSNGAAVQFVFLDAAHTILVGYTGAPAPTQGNEGNIVLIASLSDDGTGSYDFELRQPLDHPAPNGTSHYIDLTFAYTATDADGDGDGGKFTVRVDAAGTVSSISYANLSSGVFINLSDADATRASQTVAGNTATDRMAVADKVVGIDRIGDTTVAYGSQADDVLVGGHENNQLTGNAGSDLLVAGKGQDTLDGGIGNDTLVVSADVDALAGTRSFALGDGTFIDLSVAGKSGESDALTGGTGSDIVQLEMASGAGGFVFDRSTAPGTLSGVERFIGTAGNDLIMLNAAYTAEAAIRIDGGAGDDAIAGTSFDDTINGGADADLLSGLDGRDTLNGEAGNDRIHGGGGIDQIDGGEGNDVIIGGAGGDGIKGGGGDDRFVWRMDEGDDVISDISGTDTLEITQDAAAGGVHMELVAGGLGQSHAYRYNNASAQIASIHFSGVDTLDITFQNDGDDLLGNDMLPGVAVVADLAGGADTWRTTATTASDDIDGGAGIDTADYAAVSNSLGAVQINLGTTIYAAAPGGPLADETARFVADSQTWTDALHNFENAKGGTGGDLLVGSSAANQLLGNAGDDTLVGQGGDDDLQGGAGDDTIVWAVGDGSDAIDGGDDTDLAIVHGDGSKQVITITAADLDSNPANGVNDPISLAIDQDGDGTAEATVALTGVEDISFVLGGGADEIIVNASSFTGTSLAVSTIRADMGGDNDLLDLDQLASNHRVVSDGGSGDDTVQLGFAYPGLNNISALQDEAGNVIGVAITWPGAAGGPVTHEFRNFETFAFTDGARSFAELFNTAPDTNSATVDLNEDVRTLVVLSGSDAEPGPLSYRILALPENGTLFDSFGQPVSVGQVVSSPFLDFKPDTNWSGTTSFSYAARDHLGAEDPTPATITLDVAPKVDGFLIQVGGAGGDEDTSFAVPVSIAQDDSDGSQQVTQVVLTGLPAGALLNAGAVDPADATRWILTNPSAADLAQLTLTPPAEWNGEIILTVFATVRDTALLSDGAASDEYVNASQVSIRVAAVYDPSVIGDPDVADVTEDLGVVAGMLTATGTLTISDADADWQESFHSATPIGSPLGTLTLAANGAYTYSVSNSAVQYLEAGETRVEKFLVQAVDGTTREVSFTIHGVEDVTEIGDPTVSRVTEDVTEDGQLTATGTIAITDPDPGESAFLTAVTGAEGNLGSLVLQANGAYTYSVSNSAVQYLGDGESKIDTFTVTSVDGTTKQVSFTIEGANDGPQNYTISNNIVAENAPIGTLVGVLSAFDAEGDPVIWSLVNSDGGRFTLDPLTGEVRTAAVLDYEGVESHSHAISVNARNPVGEQGAGLKTFTIRIGDVNEAPTGAYTIIEQGYYSSPNTALISENRDVPAAIRLSWIGVFDDALGQEVFSLSGADAQFFEMQGSYLYLRAGVNLDYETKSAYQVTINVDDPTVGNAVDASVNLTLAVGNIVNEPVAGADSYAVGENGSLAVSGPGILANDTMPGGFPLTVNMSTVGALSLVQAPAGVTITDLGTLSVTASGSFSYLPSGDFNALRAGEQATVSFTYRAANGVVNSNTATVTVVVNGANDAASISASSPGTALVERFESGAAAWTTVGTHAVQTVRFTEGSRAMRVSADEDAPLEDMEAALGLAAGTLASQLDAYGGGAVATTVTGLTAGSYTLSFDWFYQPGDALPYNDAAFLVIDGALYKLSDIAMLGGAPSTGWQTFTMTVSLGASATLGFGEVNVTDYAFGGTLDVDLVRLSATDLVEDRVLTVSGTVTVSDGDHGESAIRVESGTSLKGYGTFTVDAAGQWTYALVNGHPDVQALTIGQARTDSFVLHSLDGTPKEITVTIRGTNDAPVVAHALTDRSSAEDSLVSFTLPANAFADDHGALTLSAALADGGALPTWLSFNAAARTFSGTPPANVNGAIDLRVTATDESGLAVSDDFRLTITPANDQPVATDDSYTVAEDQPLVVNGPGVLGNDADVEGDALTAVLFAGPSHGTLTLNTDGSFTYTPNANYIGSDFFLYQANDGTTSSASIARVNINVTAVNDAPVARDDSFTADADTVLSSNLLTNSGGNDYDVDGDPLRITSIDPTGGDPADAVAITVTGQDWQEIELAHGLLRIRADGTFAFVADDGFAGTETFGYTLSDGTVSDTAAVTLNFVENDNRAPVLNGAFGPLYAHSMDARNPASFSVQIPDGLVTDPDGDPLTWSVRTLVTTSARGGNAADDSDGIGGWWQFDAGTQTFSGTYPSSTSNQYDQAVIEITARDAHGEAVSFLTTVSGILGNSYTFPEALGYSAGTFALMFGSSVAQNGFTSSQGGLVLAGGGNDAFGGWAGHVANDAIYGEGGNDTLLGEEGNDFLHGGTGEDNIAGGAGDDIMLGGADNDRLNGGSGIDFLDGGTGNDRLYGDIGNDRIAGGAGADTFRYLASQEGTDILIDFDGGEGDVIELLAAAFGMTPGQDVGAVFGTSASADFDYAAGEKLHFDSSTHTLWFDGDGAAGIAAVALARLENGAELQAGNVHLV